MRFLTIVFLVFTLKIVAQEQNYALKLSKEQFSNKSGFLRFYNLTGYREDVEPIKSAFGANFNSQIDHNSGTHLIRMYNLSIQDMLTHGLRKSSYVVLEVKDPGKYRYRSDYGPEKEWLRKHGYCYELLMPIGIIRGIKIIDDELARLFNVKCVVEKRPLKVLVLIRTSRKETFKTLGGEKIEDHTRGIYRNVHMNIIGAPWYYLDLMPFVDETGYQSPVDLDIDLKISSLDDLPSFRKKLMKYDLDIREEIRQVEVLVIKETNDQ